MRGAVRIGACQTPEILGDVNSAVSCIEDFCGQAAAENADLLLFPECFLQGYLVTEVHVRRHALDLGSARFRSVAARLADVGPVLVVGVIERSGSRLYNSAVVLEHGQITGIYRKTHLTPGETPFDKGDEYPVFEVKGLRYGVSICYDTEFAGAAARIAGQQASVLLVPAQNMMNGDRNGHRRDPCPTRVMSRRSGSARRSPAGRGSAGMLSRGGERRLRTACPGGADLAGRLTVGLPGGHRACL